MLGLGRLWPRAHTEAQPRPRDPSDDFWFQPAGRRATVGGPVTVERARTLPVVRRSVDNLVDSVTGLPIGVFERLSDDRREKRRNHPLFEVLQDPNPETTGAEFFGNMTADLAQDGNFYGELVAGRRGPIDQIWRLEPKYMALERMSDRSIRYRYREPGAPERVFSDSQVWHIRRPPLIDNMKGASPIEEGREIIGAGLAVHDYTARFFENDATPPWVIKHPGHFKDEESKTNFMSALYKWLTGRNRHKPGLLEYGMEAVKLGVTNEEAQFLETRKEIDLAIARLWHMPPHKIGILDRATFSNIEQQALEYVVDTLTPWLSLIESSVNKHLMINPRRFYFEFNVAGLLRGDIKTRFEAYAIGRQWGWLSVNEVRALENRNGIGPAGDVYADPPNVGRRGGQGGGGERRDEAVAFLRESVAAERPRLRVVRNAA